jgi:hypothetical protein
MGADDVAHDSWYESALAFFVVAVISLAIAVAAAVWWWL